MPTRHEEHDDDAMQEILRRAIQLDGTDSGAVLRDRLLSVADELGISHESVLKAQEEYQVEAARKTELAEYHAEQRKSFSIHLVTFAAVNIFLMVLNLLTFQEDHQIWFPIPMLGWGIGLAIHAFVALSKKDWKDKEFQQWRTKRDDDEDEGE